MEARPQVPLINKWAPRLLPTKRPSSITCPPTYPPSNLRSTPNLSTHHQYNPFKTSPGQARPLPPSPCLQLLAAASTTAAAASLVTALERFITARHQGFSHDCHSSAGQPRHYPASPFALHTLLAPRRPASPAITIQ